MRADQSDLVGQYIVGLLYRVIEMDRGGLQLIIVGLIPRRRQSDQSGS